MLISVYIHYTSHVAYRNALGPETCKASCRTHSLLHGESDMYETICLK
jgi:hypothetical protein